jgi:hypothetical protein
MRRDTETVFLVTVHLGSFGTLSDRLVAVAAMQASGHDASTASGIVSPTQIDFVRFLQKCANSPHPLKKQATVHCDSSTFTSPELLADTLLNWDAGARLAGADSSETPSWPALRAQLQQQGFPHDALPHHMPYSSHADACIRGILGDVLVQYSLRGQLVQQLIDTVEFASMHDSHSSVVNGSNASVAHELSRALETNQFRSFEEAAVQRATEQSLRQQLRQAETDLQSSKERNRQLRSQVSDLEEEVHLMTRQLSKLKGNSTPAAAPAASGRWEPPQVPSFKLPSAASSPVRPAAASASVHDIQALVSENDSLKQKVASLQATYDKLGNGMRHNDDQCASCAAAALQHSCRSPAISAANSTHEGAGNVSKTNDFAVEMFRIFNVPDSNACRRVAHATAQLAKTVPYLQRFAADVSALCRQFNPGAYLDSPEEVMEVLRGTIARLAESSVGQSRDKLHAAGAELHLEQRSGSAAEFAGHSQLAAADVDGSKASGHASMFDGSKLVFFTCPHSEDSLATSPLPNVTAPAAAPSALQQPQGDAEDAAVAVAMDLVGCSRPEELLVCVEHLLAQSGELQHLRAVLSRRLDLTDPSATFVDAELGARHLQCYTAAESHISNAGIKLRDPDEVMLAVAGDNQPQLLGSAATNMQQSLAWDIVMHPARRPKPKLSPKPIAARTLQAQPSQHRDKDPSRRASSQSRQQRTQPSVGFSQQLFANFKRRLLSQHSAAAAELLSVSRQQKAGSGQSAL